MKQMILLIFMCVEIFYHLLLEMYILFVYLI